MASEQHSTPLLHQLIGDEFFRWAQKAIQTEIPNILKLVFQQSDIKSAAVFARLDDKVIGELEDFVRNDLIQEMLPTGHLIADYLGVYAKCQEKFKFLGGQKVILKMIIDVCKAHIEPIVTVPAATDPVPNQSEIVLISEDERKKYYALFKPVFATWIKNQHILNQIPGKELIFQAVSASFRKQSNGSVSFLVNCPFPGCCKNYRVHWQQYGSGYRPKIKEQSKRSPFKWFFSTLSQHIKKKHKGIDDDTQSGSETESVESNVDSLTENSVVTNNETENVESNINNLTKNAVQNNIETENIESNIRNSVENVLLNIDKRY